MEPDYKIRSRVFFLKKDGKIMAICILCFFKKNYNAFGKFLG